MRVVESTIVDAPVADVWRVLRDFNGHDRWHPAIAESRIEAGEPADLVGAVRRFRLTDGGELREQLLALSDRDHSFTYCLLDSPLPLMGYVATVRLRPVTDGDRTFWEWRSEFDPPRHRRDELTRLVAEGIYRAGFDAIRAHLRYGPAPSARPSLAAPPLLAAPSAADRVRAVVVEAHGGPEVLRPRDIPLPPPGRGEVRVRHRAIGVNFIDVYCRTGYFDLLQPPAVPGMEAAGIVEAADPATGFRPGERVAYAGPPLGAYAEARNMPPDLLVRLPDDVSDETAAAGLLKGMTASFLLHDVHRVTAGTAVLVHAGAGGIGQLLVQWAGHLGAEVVATASTADKRRLIEAWGARAIPYEGFPAVVRDLTGGRGADVVYDAVGRDTFAGSLEAVAVRGHLVSFGQASGPVGSWDVGAFASRSLTLSRPNYGHYTGTPDLLASQAARFLAALRDRVLTVPAPTRYPLDRAADAHRDLETRRTTGPLILTV